MIKIDGSYGEGGGQILRYAALYALISNKPVVVHSIRAKRPNPGLRPQHLTLLKIIKEAFKGEVSGLHVGSTEVHMHFKGVRGLYGKYSIGTAGSISLILQSLIPPLLYADQPSNFTLVGGTDVKWSPPIDYMRSVYISLVRRFGGIIEIDVKKRGFYPRGGGVVNVKVYPSSLKGWKCKERQDIKEIVVYNTVYNLPRHVLERQKNTSLKCLSDANLDNIIIKDDYGRGTLDPGTSVVVVGFHSDPQIASGGDSLGERGKPAEKVAMEACNHFLSWFRSKATLDVHAGDMAIPLSILADDKVLFSVPQITSHMESAIYVSRMFRDFTIKMEKYENYTTLYFE